MEFAEQIDGAPKNGDFIILQDAGSREVGRWAQEANGWVHPDGTPVRISPTHWTRVSDDFAGPTDRERSLFLAALAPLPDDETKQTQRRPLTRLILALVTAIFCIGGFVFWIGSKDSSSDNSAADLEREFSRERDRASVAIGALTAARERENVALTEALESKRIANSKQKELKQALDKSEARSEALARELASARENDVAARNLAAARERENAAQAMEAKQTADASQKELKQALDESEKKASALERELTSARETIASVEKPSLKQEREHAARLEQDLAAARRDVETQTALVAKAGAEVSQLKKTADAGSAELRKSLQQERDRASRLEQDLVAARRDAETQTALAAKASDEAAQLKRGAEEGSAELKQSLQKEQEKAETLAQELATARAWIYAFEAQARQASDQAAELKQTAEGGVADLRTSLQQERDRASRLEQDLVAARRDVEKQTALAAKAGEEAGQMKQAADSAAELRKSLEQERERAARLEQDLVAARRDVEKQTALAAKAGEEAGQMKQAADSAAELQKSLKQERERAARLEHELAAARRDVEKQTALAAKAGDEAGQTKRTAESEVAELRKSLVREWERTARLERDLAAERRDVEKQTALAAKTKPSAPEEKPVRTEEKRTSTLEKPIIEPVDRVGAIPVPKQAELDLRKPAIGPPAARTSGLSIRYPGPTRPSTDGGASAGSAIGSPRPAASRRFAIRPAAALIAATARNCRNLRQFISDLTRRERVPASHSFGREGAPCPVRNRSDADAVPELPDGFVVDTKREDWD